MLRIYAEALDRLRVRLNMYLVRLISRQWHSEGQRGGPPRAAIRGRQNEDDNGNNRGDKGASDIS